MTKLKAFYFWETLPGKVKPEYLDLCVKTWEKNAPDLDIVHVNYENVEDVTRGDISIKQIEKLPLPIQSDVIAAATLRHHPGFFLDIDTVILPDFDISIFPNNGKLSVYGTPETLINTSLGFFYTAKAGNVFLEAWYEEVKKRIMLQHSGLRYFRTFLRWHLQNKPMKIKWNYLGNDIFDPLAKDTQFNKYLDVRSSIQTGFTVHEALNQPYEQFWFDGENSIDSLLNTAKDKILCLQNSWTPQKYMQMSQKELLDDNCLFSKTIKYSLGI